MSWEKILCSFEIELFQGIVQPFTACFTLCSERLPHPTVNPPDLPWATIPPGTIGSRDNLGSLNHRVALPLLWHDVQPLKKETIYCKSKLMSSNLVEALNCASASELLGRQRVKWLLTSHCLNSLFFFLLKRPLKWLKSNVFLHVINAYSAGVVELK